MIETSQSQRKSQEKRNNHSKDIEGTDNTKRQKIGNGYSRRPDFILTSNTEEESGLLHLTNTVDEDQNLDPSDASDKNNIGI